MIEDLLPLSTESPRCSEFAQSLGLQPAGSGLFLDRVVLVSVPGPWPKPALKHPDLEAAATHLQGSAVKTRPFAMEPGPEQVPGTIVVEVFERAAASAIHLSWTLHSVPELTSLAETIADTPHGELAAVAASTGTLPVTLDAAPSFLVCVQGSHDRCCGVSGVALADEIEAQRSYLVRRVSHTGGHRFAPTFLAFPEGRMWAYADLALVDRIAANTATVEDHRTLARGWWGAPVGAAQVAECAVRAERSDVPFSEPMVETSSSEGSVEVTVGDQSFVVEVAISRHVPSIACEALGGLPAKPSREFNWVLTQPGADDG